MKTLLIVLIVLLIVLIGVIVYMIFSVVKLTRQIKHVQQTTLEMTEKLSFARDKISLIALGAKLFTTLTPKIFPLKKYFKRGKKHDQATRKTAK